MTRQDVVQSHLETLMERYLGTDDLQIEEDGDIPVAYRSAVYRVRVLPGEKPHVGISAVMIRDIDPDPGLYEALNELNSRLSHARAFWVDSTVVLAAELVGLGLDLDDLECTCGEIAVTAHCQGPRLAQIFGGTVANPDDVGDNVAEE